MSVDGPQLSQGQQGIGHNGPVQGPGKDSGNIKAKKSLSKQIGHKLAKLLPDKAKKLFSGHRSVQVLLPKSVEATPGLKDSSVKLVSVKPLSERNPQVVDITPKLGGDNPALLQRRDSSSSFDSGFGGDGDNLSISSNDSYASIRSTNSDDGYDSIKFDQSEFIDDDNDYMTADEAVKGSSVPMTDFDLENEDQYSLVDNPEVDDAPDAPETSEETVTTSTGEDGEIGATSTGNTNTGGDSEQGSSGESAPDEPTISSEDVLTRKYAAYEQLIDSDDFGALEEKLANTNNYQTSKKVAQLALEKQGKTSLVFMVAQNRMQELKADQLFDQLGGFGQGADYDLIREQAAEAMNQSRYSPGYQARVMELVDQKLEQYREIIADPPPPVQGKSEALIKELETPQVQETPIEEEAPPLPPRSETPTKSKKRGIRMPGFLRRSR